MLEKYVLVLFSSKYLTKDLLWWAVASAAIVTIWAQTAIIFFPEFAPINIEIFGTLFSLICVGLITKQNLWSWPFGILGVLLLGSAFLTYGLISTAILHFLFFFPCQFHGWWAWVQGNDNNRPIKTLGIAKTIALAGLIIAIPASLWALNIEYIASLVGDSVPQFPWPDAIIMWFSVAAQLLMNYKILESWLFWLALDTIAIVVYFLSGLYMVSALYCVFLVIAVLGYIAWRNALAEAK